MSTYQARAREILERIFEPEDEPGCQATHFDHDVDQALSELASIVEELIPAKYTLATGYLWDNFESAEGFNYAVDVMRKRLSEQRDQLSNRSKSDE